MMQPLKLYRASAGSGKTFTLAVEYIKLLIINQWEYKHILAVTFTNKATAEMKERILSTLYGLAHGLKSGDSYLDAIRNAEEIKALSISDDEIRRRAGIALNNLAHDYSRFHIATIDSFFVSVIKDLAHELDLTANLNIDLGDTDVLDEAVDNIIDSLQEGSETFRNLKSFIQEKIDQESNWKIDQEIKDFGKNIFNEHYLSQSHLIADQIQDSVFMAAYRKMLRTHKAEALRQLKQAGEDFLRICETHGFSAENFKQKQRGVWGFFSQLAEGKELPTPNSYVTKCLNTADEWSKDKTLCALAASTFIPLLQSVLDDTLPKSRKTVTTVNAIYQHLSHLQLLSTISTQVERLNNEANRFLLANAAHFLRRMIDRSSVPFIYEKSGTQFNHIMIDEFQDTSALQWSNFLPLLTNSLDSAQTCLIVGDVKQSIYRFRNSDWQILNTLADVPCLAGKIQEKPLDYNRRSLGNIIDFNNAFFQKAVQAVDEDYSHRPAETDGAGLRKAYSDVAQKKLADKEGKGYVSIEILQKDEDDEEEESDYDGQTLDLLVSHVTELIQQGIRPRDIAILLRKNQHIPLINQHFALHAKDIKLVSDEAFQLKASASIQIIILALKYLVNPNDKYTLAWLINLWRTHAWPLGSTTSRSQGGDLLLTDTLALESMLPEPFIQAKDTLLFEPLKELIEKIYVFFQLDQIPRQDAYLFFFHDQLTAFSAEKKADINSFLNFWDEKLSEKTIPGSLDDGVRIMTIHKSKGLEFHTVIIPFCDWKTTGKPEDLLWCTPREAPYNQLKLIPVNFKQELVDSIFMTDYQQEALLNSVDNLNILYVAFTRAVSNLFIITGGEKHSTKKNEKKQDEGDTIKNVKQLIQRSIPSFMTPQEDNPQKLEYGTLVTTHDDKKDTKADEETNPLQQEYQRLDIQFRTNNQLPEFRQSNKSKDFMADKQTPFIDRGLLYHAILQEIHTLADTDRIIDKMNTEGHFSSAEELREVSQHIHHALSNPFAARWFADTWQVVNERSILAPAGQDEWKELRADRVILSPTETIVIDYKTGSPSPAHEDQVRTYMQLLTQMGYPGVSGYVWYIITGKTTPVHI